MDLTQCLERLFGDGDILVVRRCQCGEAKGLLFVDTGAEPLKTPCCRSMRTVMSLVRCPSISRLPVRLPERVQRASNDSREHTVQGRALVAVALKDDIDFSTGV